MIEQMTAVVVCSSFIIAMSCSGSSLGAGVYACLVSKGVFINESALHGCVSNLYQGSNLLLTKLCG
ncbi:unnamed protein product [Haemonchus placei]|uniref:Secreted protein n=1 Tax=Haemonchus placei TaxID=6290 RepID=A0A0N4VTK6_HAEPC|nr:unnamed protein product [Haemonchus placei]